MYIVTFERPDVGVAGGIAPERESHKDETALPLEDITLVKARSSYKPDSR
jgi:hypothetical protein